MAKIFSNIFKNQWHTDFECDTRSLTLNDHMNSTVVCALCTKHARVNDHCIKSQPRIEWEPEFVWSFVEIYRCSLQKPLLTHWPKWKWMQWKLINFGTVLLFNIIKLQPLLSIYVYISYWEIALYLKWKSLR